MAKKSILEREKKRSKLVTKYSEKKSELKLSVRTAVLMSDKMKLHAQLHSIPRNASFSRIRRRCWLTGRGRGCYRDFGLSRHAFREMAHACLIPGVTKSSW